MFKQLEKKLKQRANEHFELIRRYGRSKECSACSIAVNEHEHVEIEIDELTDKLINQFLIKVNDQTK